MNRFSAQEKNAGKASAAGAKRRKLIWLTTVVLFFSWAGYTFFSQSSLIADKSTDLVKKQGMKNDITNSLNQLKYDVSRLNDNEYIGQLARKWYNMYPQGETPIRTEHSDK